MIDRRQFLFSPYLTKQIIVIACTTGDNQPLMCVEGTCTVPTFKDCTKKEGEGILSFRVLKPQSFQAYNSCKQLDVWKGKDKANQPTNHVACEWNLPTDPNNQRPHCKECYVAKYTPFEYGLCPQKPPKGMLQ
ncbi:hypothetical protein O181_029183 [Austropuccinia psidii MF-1]|uniref:Uncharacterized protein n=1 Tax=Austropuccinia psidii MF-1 TaxID=1389203 RepID=A0A9Q3CT19_9BASI|nr:hypothetical protein [Austropuccinia psidii MF-1]